MGIMDEADRTLFVGNLDPQVTEELLFELFLQVRVNRGPLLMLAFRYQSSAMWVANIIDIGRAK